MYEGVRIGVVIPARNEEKHLPLVLATIPDYVDNVVVVDDGSTDNTAACAQGYDVISLQGEGVGAAIDAGHRHLLTMFDDEFISVVMAGDGQMNPGDMPRLLSPIINKKAHYVKGERKDRAGKMPNLRRFGTMLLAFLTTLACGQTIRDPQCGYTATSSKVLESWNWDISWKGYGYPNWWLMRLSELGWMVTHAPVEAIYDGQKSGLKVASFLPKVSLMLLIGIHMRIIRNTAKNPSVILLLIWISYVMSWVYSPFAFIITHLLDRIHVRTILRDFS